jgi:hypothetical protein
MKAFEPCDYQMNDRDADALRAAAVLPHEFRRKLLAKHLREYSRAALVDLFSQFIGLANSVVANNREMVEMLLVIEGKMHPQTAEKANLPTVFGALAAEHRMTTFAAGMLHAAQLADDAAADMLTVAHAQEVFMRQRQAEAAGDALKMLAEHLRACAGKPPPALAEYSRGGAKP